MSRAGLIHVLVVLPCGTGDPEFADFPFRCQLAEAVRSDVEPDIGHVVQVLAGDQPDDVHIWNGGGFAYTPLTERMRWLRRELADADLTGLDLELKQVTLGEGQRSPSAERQFTRK